MSTGYIGLIVRILNLLVTNSINKSFDLLLSANLDVILMSIH